MNDIILELEKRIENNYEKIIVYKNGHVEYEILSDGNLTKNSKDITIANTLEQELNKILDILNFLYKEEQNPNYSVKYNNYSFNSFDLYIDIYLMIKNNMLRDFSASKKYKQKKSNIQIENETLEKLKILDEMENNKEKIDLSNFEKEINLDNDREIISFKLIEKSSFDLGESRFFSDSIDIAENIEIPEYLEFVGQLNLSEISKFDKYNLLPKSGMLYFFQSPFEVNKHFYEFGKVIYSENINLKTKKINENNRDMILNFSLKNISNEIEKFSDRYEVFGQSNTYNPTKGEDLNKIFGFYTDCQMNENDILKISDKYIVLLQLGSDIYGEGVTTFLISKDDLKNKNFNNIIYNYSQS